ncbi:probable inactive purple acid phosphatase 27 [Nicotiana sylvestris]|uniref:Purple acid phosphatase n=1 Tax=Nicotiana sylvestris TaxID=4096 RepID=A0A1U7VV50_NICSY|nr:PREDICTED: probable inactive purple acid phosphatase 27 [Nicotiana sylvestris]
MASFYSLYKTILFTLFVLLTSASSSSSSTYYLSNIVVNSTAEFINHTAISEFRILNRRVLAKCPDPNPYLSITTASNSSLSDEGFVTVHVSGVLLPSKGDWVGMISPSYSDVSSCPFNAIQYQQTGDLSQLPLLCHYPVKAQYLSKDPGYLRCKKKECKKYVKGSCVERSCSASLSFHVVNFRTDIEFVLFAGGFATPCILKTSNKLSFTNPKQPLHAHLSTIDSTGTSMRVTWVSGDRAPQQLQYGNGKSVPSKVSTFTQKDMCSAFPKSPAKDFGWHDPGFIHSAVMTGLNPSTTYSYTYGSDSAGWSGKINLKTPPAGGSDEVRFLAYGDMGKAPRDPSAEHYIQPGSLAVTKAMADEISSGNNVDSIFHIGDISYATGFLVEWDYFLQLITPVASHVSYMTAIGNHERDYVGTGSVYGTPDSGGECGVPYETYFQMPTAAKDKPWYSTEQGSVHFTIISTEHNWSHNSDQYEWMRKDMASVDRSRTPWLIFMGHRPMYSSVNGVFLKSVDEDFVKAVEPLLLANKVDLALWGHVHNYERSCAVYQKECKALPTKGAGGIDTYDNTNYTAPVHAVIGMAGFSLDKFPSDADKWSLVRIAEFGYVRVHATTKALRIEYVNANTRKLEDSFQITRS